MIETRKFELDHEGKHKFIVIPFLEFSGIETFLDYDPKIKDFHEFSNDLNKKDNCPYLDSEGLHIIFENVGNLNKTGIFYWCSFPKPQKNYYYLLMHRIVPEFNINECIHTLIIPAESNFFMIL